MALKPEATIYTDGSCLGNPGPGGWGAVVLVGKEIKKMSGGLPSTTNNRMELTGAINALSALRGPHIIHLYTDSQYLVNAFEKGWLHNWKAHNWEKADGDLKNKDLWKLLDQLTAKHAITWHWVKGHAGNKYNEICDKLAVAAAQKAAQNGADADLIFGTEESTAKEEKADETEAQQLTLVDAPNAAPNVAPGNTQDNCAALDKVRPILSQATVETVVSAYLDTMWLLDRFIKDRNEKELDFVYPCGERPWCAYCSNMKPSPNTPECAMALCKYEKEIAAPSST